MAHKSRRWMCPEGAGGAAFTQGSTFALVSHPGSCRCPVWRALLFLLEEKERPGWREAQLLYCCQLPPHRVCHLWLHLSSPRPGLLSPLSLGGAVWGWSRQSAGWSRPFVSSITPTFPLLNSSSAMPLGLWNLSSCFGALTSIHSEVC